MQGCYVYPPGKYLLVDMAKLWAIVWSNQEVGVQRLGRYMVFYSAAPCGLAAFDVVF